MFGVPWRRWQRAQRRRSALRTQSCKPDIAGAVRVPIILGQVDPVLLALSLDDFVGTQQHAFRDRESKRLRGLQVDDQIELGRLLEGDVARLRTLQDLV